MMQDKKNETWDSEENRTRIRTLWNKSSAELYQKQDTPLILHKLKDRPGMVFHQTVYSDIQDLLTEKQIKKVCVLGSGDNEAVFAFQDVLKEKGVRIISKGPQTIPDTHPVFAGTKVLYIQDPEGHPLELMQMPK